MWPSAINCPLLSVGSKPKAFKCTHVSVQAGISDLIRKSECVHLCGYDCMTFSFHFRLCALVLVSSLPASSIPRPSLLVSISYLLISSSRFLPFYPGAHRPRCVPPSSPCPALGHGGGWRKRRKRGREVLLLVRSLVQQPADGPAALRGQETPQECSQSTPPGAASGQSGCHGEHRSASWPRARHK